MISKKNYEALQERFGAVSSWAIWGRPTTSAKSNTADMSVFKRADILETLNPHYVFVGLNCSSTHGDRRDGYKGPWSNFHSDYAYQNDYKLRYALMDTPYWGGYITDVIKRYAEVDSNKVAKFLRDNPEIAKINIDEFKEELELLDKNPVLVALGGKVYEILKTYLGDEYTIVQVKHYSYTISKEDYRKEVLYTLDSVEGK